MVKSFHVLTVVLVSVGMALSLAHALELPGKLRLGREAYLAVQPIYYPGFTYGGLIGEFGSLVALAVLLYLLPFAGNRFWWTAAALALFAASHLTYWFVTHPVNGFWLKDTQLDTLSSGFFSIFSAGGEADWTKLRDIWEYSHVARAILSMASFVAVTVALAL
jgi:hypothetical protein